jgi:hypothetical protein
MTTINEKHPDPCYYEVAQLSLSPSAEVVRIWHASTQEAALKLTEELGLKNYRIQCIKGERICRSPAYDNLQKQLEKKT